ncbi:hypothetical protein O6H91_12G043600 [Diphasiastrum complanatum]|uniref:Uncharacterized protein n=1 Tax=Diphasiastrum complanatum TaxID=34168 RepID=A0ACC2C1I8_DIPCM|nr:hypothetical protein O6H91_12G043600 [Diphasiastrum complanatum]
MLNVISSRFAMTSKIAVEYAKSSRSACKHCGDAVSKGEVRLGAISKAAGGFEMIRWHHPHCFFRSQPHNEAFDLEKSSGFNLLKQSDQLHLKQLLTLASSQESQRSPKRMKKDEQDVTADQKLLLRYDSKAWEKLLSSYTVSQLSNSYKGAVLPSGWKAYSSVICGKVNVALSSEKIAAFDFDGCLVNTSVRRVGAQAWSLLYPSIPEKLQQYHEEGYKLVIFTNESNIDRWKNSRQKAVDSKLGRLEGFMELVKAPMQVFVACSQDGSGDPCRKPSPGMWDLMERHFNAGIQVEKTKSFFVGDAAGRASDHSDADIGFAKAIGLPFMVPEEVFKS